ncbi:MAG: hypothetical protein U0521_10115 [Anaerolineae bacterium]
MIAAVASSGVQIMRVNLREHLLEDIYRASAAYGGGIEPDKHELALDSNIIAVKDWKEVLPVNRMVWTPILVPLIFVVVIPLAVTLIPQAVTLPSGSMSGDLDLPGERFRLRCARKSPVWRRTN